MKNIYIIVFILLLVVSGCRNENGETNNNNDLTDVIAPSRITDLMLIGCSNNACSLNWTAVGDDIGQASSYIIKYSINEITDDNFDIALSPSYSPTPRSEGLEEDFTIGNLDSETTYYFAIKAVDESSNQGELSNLVSGTTVNDGAQLIMPEDLNYLGAFRLPGPSNGASWNNSGGAYYGGGDMTYYPGGDSNGPNDGYVGSIYGIGKYGDDVRVSEFNIPVPVISLTKDLNELNTATTLQGFQDLRAFDLTGNTAAIASIQYMPPQGEQLTGKLYYSWAEYFQFSGGYLSQSWSELDLSNPQIQGGWYVGDGQNPHNMTVGGFMFSIPKNWADVYTPGQYLVAGRYSTLEFGAGPSLTAYGPWNHGNPPPDQTQLDYVTLLRYGSYSNQLNNYTGKDRWYGGAWITEGNNSAVIISGVKALGNVWYGYKDGTEETDCMHSNPPGPIDCSDKGQRGWQADDFSGRLMFYNPDDLAQVALGNIESYSVQPYAFFEANDYLFHGTGDEHEGHRLGAVSYDRERNILYITELFGDGSKPIMHVWGL